MNKKLQLIFILVTLDILSCKLPDSNIQGNMADSTICVGTQQFIWEDDDRLDKYYGAARKVNVRVWYPGHKTSVDSVRTPYLLFESRLYNRLNGWSKNDYQTAKSIKTASFLGVPVLHNSNKVPLLIFSPSLGGNLSYYTYYAEFFAQRGYIVMGINHLHESEAVIDKNSNFHPVNTNFHDSLKTLNIPEDITADDYRATKGKRQNVLAKDIIFALNQLLSETAIGNKIDINKIGAFGHSIGGAAAVLSSLIDDRIKAVIDLDGTPPSVALNNGIGVPFLFIEDLTDYQNHPGYAKMHQRRSNFCEKNRADSWRVLINGFNHNSFLDVNYYFAENPDIANQEQENLDLILTFMKDFLNFYLLGDSELSLEPGKTTKTETMYFEK